MIYVYCALSLLAGFLMGVYLAGRMLVTRYTLIISILEEKLVECGVKLERRNGRGRPKRRTGRVEAGEV